jgi:hypothetical protein
VLRIGDRRIARAPTEECRIELVDVVEHRCRLDIRGVAQHRMRFACGEQGGVGQRPDRLDPLAQVGPESRGIGRAGKSAGHADDCDVGSLLRLVHAVLGVHACGIRTSQLDPASSAPHPQRIDC